MLRALVNDLWATSPGFLPQQLPAVHRALWFAIWWWAWGLCGKHHSLPNSVRGRCAYPCSSSAPAFTRETEPHLLCFLPSLASSLVAVHPPSKNALFWALVVKIRLVSQLLFFIALWKIYPEFRYCIKSHFRCGLYHRHFCCNISGQVSIFCL